MLIEIWSDVVCPWCYIGKRRLEAALADFAHTDEVEVVWRSFQLDPGAPDQPDETIAEHLGRKYGGGTGAGQQMVDQIEAVAAEEGMLFRFGRAQRVGTRDAHRLLHLALEGGAVVQGELKEELLAAYFLRAENVADHDVLRAAAGKVGLDAASVEEVLAGAAYAAAVQADIDRAQAYGASGVPFVVVDQKYGVSGAQPAATFAQVLQRAWDDAHPALQTIGDGDVCGPEGCAP